MAKYGSFTFIMLMLLGLQKTSAQFSDDSSWLNPAPGRQNYIHTLTHAVARARHAGSFEQNILSSVVGEVLADFSVLQTELLALRHETKPDQILKYSGLIKDILSVTNSACANDTGRLVMSLLNKKDRWSLQFLDANGKPGAGLMLLHVNFVGDYKQCRNAQAPSNTSIGLKGFKGNYCALMAKPPGDIPFGLAVGTCLPDTCTETDLTVLTEQLVRKFMNGTLVATQAKCHSDERPMTTATVVAITVLCLILAMVLSGTVIDIVYVQCPKWKKEIEDADMLTNTNRVGSLYGAVGSDEGLLGHNDVDETALLIVKPTPTLGLLGKIFVSFSVYTNASKVLNTSQPPGSLGTVHGIRFLSMSWVMLCHTFAFGAFFFRNLEMFETLLNRWTFTVIANGFASVDTFFTLSGLLTAYLTYQMTQKYGWRINWFLFYFHRIWRLTPPYMLILLMVLGFQQYFGSGALWDEIQPADRDNCNEYWWSNLLYVNNLISASKMCFVHSWYLSNDMQFFFISPLLIIPFCFKRVYGVLACMIFLAATIITTAILSVQNAWPVTLVSLRTTSLMGSWFEDYYIKPWCRLGPYVIGVLTGVMLAHYKRIHMPKFVVILGWILATAIGLAVVYGINGDLTGDNPSSLGAAAFYNSVSRTAWAVCVCWVIVACTSGYGGLVNSLLSWSPFVVLGRLTFVAYLIHPCVYSVYYQNRDQLFQITDTSIAVTFCGLLVCTYLVSFILMLLFESPMIGLERVLLRRKHKE
ncbi:nose resistant to fluoxetine protein 6 [Biomphalaria pfeifferi]|uniref:Nose resistant to fluoxetine protein 6 n=1 Tax=Biomphalaria pfeifferi TaxID=112525 RepID=A0AAD8BFP4_BIOPF|nr:nose resistant to fluoxetine protein 6 [Biomphalaria pfeifferi]